MKRLLSATCAAVMFSATLFAAQYDRLLDAIYVPDGAYFDTGYVVKDHPRVIASISVGEMDYDFDLFGVKHRSEGCWILNVDGTTTGVTSQVSTIATERRRAAARLAATPPASASTSTAAGLSS